MLKPRLPDDDVIATAQLLPADQVSAGDPRLTDEERWRRAAASSRAASFIGWSDGALGFAYLSGVGGWMEAFDRLVAYQKAREALERLVLERFEPNNPTLPQ